jgi:hypothetical protein
MSSLRLKIRAGFESREIFEASYLFINSVIAALTECYANNMMSSLGCLE